VITAGSSTLRTRGVESLKPANLFDLWFVDVTVYGDSRVRHITTPACEDMMMFTDILTSMSNNLTVESTGWRDSGSARKGTGVLTATTATSIRTVTIIGGALDKTSLVLDKDTSVSALAHDHVKPSWKTSPSLLTTDDPDQCPDS
jgi:hypothetical protein